MGNKSSHKIEKSSSVSERKNGIKKTIQRPQAQSVPIKINELEPALNSETFILQQTGLTLSDIEKIFKKYIEINPQGDELNRKEFAELYISLRSEDCEKLEKLTDYIFNSFDTDHNGYVSFEEFLIGYSFTTRRGLEKKLEYAFNMFDLDGDGLLSQSELNEVLTAMISLFGFVSYNSENLTKCCFGLMCKNGDGKINQDQFIQFLKRDFGLRSIMCPFQ